MGLSSKQVLTNDHDWSQQSLLHAATPLKQQKEPPLNCPRCDSLNTKFCYYNNYNRSQPRYYCKSCKRHWTKGGNLRNVPVGGARRNQKFKTTKKGGDNRELIKGIEDQTLSFPIPLPNFTSPSFISSSTSTYFNGGMQLSDGLVGGIEKSCSSGVTSTVMKATPSLMDSWSWDEFNTLISTDMEQPWGDHFEVIEQGI
ncbi:hypothetical protein ACHQM5_003066 [Ranunculus cassubicifolius]